MQSWVVSKLWPGSTVFIIGGGVSLLDTDLSLLDYRYHTIGVNDAFKLLPVDVVWFTDCRWYKWNAEALQYHIGLIVGAPRCNCDHPRVLQIRRDDCSGITTNPEEVYWNKNSGTSAINLAYHLGAKRVILLGFDMKMTDGKHNFHKNHPHTPRNNIYEDLFLPCYERVARDAERLGLEILNATPGSAIEVFPKVDLKEILSWL